MHKLVTAALAAIAVASAGVALAADGQTTPNHGAPVAVVSSLARSGAGSGKTGTGGGGVSVRAKPQCLAGYHLCGKDCRPANIACPRV